MIVDTDHATYDGTTNVTECSCAEQEPPDICPADEDEMARLLHRFRTDMDFRYKVKRSASATWIIFLVGWAKGLIGPSFPEILYLTDTTLERGSAYLTTLYTSKIVGHALGGLLYDRVDTDLYNVAVSVINAVVLSILPWCRQYGTMIMMYGLHGLFISSLEIGMVTESVNLWDNEARQFYLQITMFIFSISTILSPLAEIPFLMDIPAAENTATVVNYTGNVNITEHFIGHRNDTDGYFTVQNVPYIGESSFNSSDLSSVAESTKQSILYLVFTLTAVLILSGGVQFLVFFCFRKRKDSNEQDKQTSKLCKEESVFLKHDNDIYHSNTDVKSGLKSGSGTTNSDVTENLLNDTRDSDIKVNDTLTRKDTPNTVPMTLSCSNPLVIIMFAISCFFGAVHSAIEIAMSDLMPTFCFNFLNWPASQAALSVSLLYLFLTIGRIACAFLVKCFTMTKLLLVYVIICILGNVGLSVSANAFFTPGIWVAVGAIGLGLSICYPSQLGWTSQYLLPLSGKLTAVLLCTMYMGSIASPALLGYLMTSQGYMSLCYSLLVISGMGFVCVVCMALYVRQTQSDSVRDVDIKV